MKYTDDDGITYPSVSATKVRQAIETALRYIKGDFIREQELQDAIEIMKEASSNRNWVIYVP